MSGSGTPSRGSRRIGTGGDSSGASAGGLVTSLGGEGGDALRRQSGCGAQQVDKGEQVRPEISGVGGPGRTKFDGDRGSRAVQIPETRRGGLRDGPTGGAVCGLAVVQRVGEPAP